jgi:peptidoglycan/LPS O-acetylase OafA/YrhL
VLVFLFDFYWELNPLRFWSILLIAFLAGVALRLSTYGVWTCLIYFPVFACGILLYKLKKPISARLGIASLVAYLAVGILLYLIPLTRGTLVGYYEPRPEADLLYMVWTLSLVPFIGWNISARSTSFDRHLGNLSFPLYLVHVFIFHLTRPAFGASTPLFKLSSIAAALIATIAIYVIIDLPLEALRKRLRKSGVA